MIDLQTRASLTVLYSEPHRKYHNLNHIRQCLKELEEICLIGLIENDNEFLLIEKAIWWHDAVYDPMLKDNEKSSARLWWWSEREKKTNGVIEAMILASNHKEESFKNACLSYFGSEAKILKYFLDIDLSILGSNEKEYKEYAKNIREEYSFVPKDLYAIGRKNILTSFLDKNSIYKSEHFKKKYENIARKNIQLEIERLDRGEFE